MFSKRIKLALIAAAAIASVSSSSSAIAGQIFLKDPTTGFDSGWVANVDDGIDLTVFSVQGDFTSLSIEKFANFTQAPNADGFIPPLKITFAQLTNTATQFIKISDEFVRNNTGVTWTGFSWKVESDHMGGNGGPQLVPGQSADFGTAPFGTQAYDQDNTRLIASGGTLPDGSTWQPGDTGAQGAGNDGSLVIQASPFVSGNIRQVFVLKEQPLFNGETPVIPLPAAAWSGLTGLVGLGVISLRKNVRRFFA